MWIWDDEKFGDLVKLGKKHFVGLERDILILNSINFLRQYRIRELLFGEKKAIQEIDDWNSGLYDAGKG